MATRTLPQALQRFWGAQQSVDAMLSVRRGFHTLKGDARVTAQGASAELASELEGLAVLSEAGEDIIDYLLGEDYDASRPAPPLPPGAFSLLNETANAIAHRLEARGPLENEPAVLRRLEAMQRKAAALSGTPTGRGESGGQAAGGGGQASGTGACGARAEAGRPRAAADVPGGGGPADAGPAPGLGGADGRRGGRGGAGACAGEAAHAQGRGGADRGRRGGHPADRARRGGPARADRGLPAARRDGRGAAGGARRCARRGGRAAGAARPTAPAEPERSPADHHPADPDRAAAAGHLAERHRRGGAPGRHRRQPRGPTRSGRQPVVAEPAPAAGYPRVWYRVPGTLWVVWCLRRRRPPRVPLGYPQGRRFAKPGCWRSRRRCLDWRRWPHPPACAP